MAFVPSNATPGTLTALNGPIGSFVIVPGNANDLPTAVRWITIGTTAGTIRWRDVNGNVQDTDVLPLGTYPIQAHRVQVTGTTAVGLTGWI
jgi:hypothetical protein